VEITSVRSDVNELDELLRAVRDALIQALAAVPTPDQVPPMDRNTVQDIRWTVAEALRLNRDYRSRIADRLAGATPGPSHPTSTHDPPDACQARSSPP
jgi:hypothetical protein